MFDNSAFKILSNHGPGDIVVKHLDPASDDANQIHTQDGQDYIIRPGDVAGFVYDPVNHKWEPMWPTCSQVSQLKAHCSQWMRWDVPFTALADFASTEETIVLATLPAKTFIEVAYLVSSEAYGPEGFIVDLGDESGPSTILGAFPADTFPVGEAYTSGFPGPLLQFEPRELRLKITSSANLDQATSGMVHVFLQTSILP